MLGNWNTWEKTPTACWLCLVKFNCYRIGCFGTQFGTTFKVCFVGPCFVITARQGQTFIHKIGRLVDAVRYTHWQHGDFTLRMLLLFLHKAQVMNGVMVSAGTTNGFRQPEQRNRRASSVMSVMSGQSSTHG